MDRWVDRLIGDVVEGPSVVGIFGRLLRVASGLGATAAQRFLEGQLTLALEPGIAREVSQGMLFSAVKAHLERLTTRNGRFFGLSSTRLLKRWSVATKTPPYGRQ